MTTEALSDVAVSEAPPKKKRTSRQFNPWVLYSSAIGSLLILTAYTLIAFWETPVDALRLHARYTARASFILFLLPFTARPLAQLINIPATQWLVRNRRTLGLTFAICMAAHFVTTMILLAIEEEASDIVTITLGPIVYIAIALMALTSFEKYKRKIGRHWRLLHSTGNYLILSLMVFSYAYTFFIDIDAATLEELGVSATSSILYNIFLFVIVITILIRVAARLKTNDSFLMNPSKESMFWKKR
jgi:DMSO/TMAO reductase YedYZ heme-binding membrane subunit